MKQLLIVWKSENDIDIHHFLRPYALNSKRNGWMSEVEVLIWGASQEKVMNDVLAQEVVKSLVSEGIQVYACKYCSDQVNATELLSSLGVKVMYTGVFLSDKQNDPMVEVLTI